MRKLIVKSTRMHTFLDRDTDVLATYYEESGRVEFNCLSKDYYWAEQITELHRFIGELAEFIKLKERERKKEIRRDQETVKEFVKGEVKVEGE